MFECSRCSRKFEKSQSYCAHKSHCGKDPKTRMSLESRDRANKALLNSDRSKAARTRLDRYPEYYIELCNKATKARSSETFKKQSETRKRRYASGELEPAHGVGRGKKGWYKNIWCDSSWELAWVIYQLEHSIVFERNKDRFPLSHKGNKVTFIPDFKIDGNYLEIKGWINPLTISKMEQYPNFIWILPNSPEMNEVLSYVTNKYGKDFIKLYSPQ